MGNAECGRAPAKLVVKLGGAGGSPGDLEERRECCCAQLVLDGPEQAATSPAAKLAGGGAGSAEAAAHGETGGDEDRSTCGGDGVEGTSSRPSCDQWELPVEDTVPVEPTLLLARFKALPVRPARREERSGVSYLDSLTEWELTALDRTGILAALDLIEEHCCQVEHRPPREVLIAEAQGSGYARWWRSPDAEEKAALRLAQNLCLVCLNVPAAVTCMPCGHLALCEACTGLVHVQQCPVCRGSVVLFDCEDRRGGAKNKVWPPAASLPRSERGSSTGGRTTASRRGPPGAGVGLFSPSPSESRCNSDAENSARDECVQGIPARS